jgi:hypothetical protein
MTHHDDGDGRDRDPFDGVSDVDDRICDWVDGCMSERDRARFEAELRVSPQLRRQLEDYEATVADVRDALRQPVADLDVTGRVMARLAQEATGVYRGAGAQAGPRAPRPIRPLLATLASAAALLAVTVWVSAWGSGADAERAAVATATDLDAAAPPADSDAMEGSLPAPRSERQGAAKASVEALEQEVLKLDEKAKKRAAAVEPSARPQPAEQPGAFAGRAPSQAAPRPAPNEEAAAAGELTRADAGAAPAAPPTADVRSVTAPSKSGPATPGQTAAASSPTTGRNERPEGSLPAPAPEAAAGGSQAAPVASPAGGAEAAGDPAAVADAQRRSSASVVGPAANARPAAGQVFASVTLECAAPPADKAQTKRARGGPGASGPDASGPGASGPGASGPAAIGSAGSGSAGTPTARAKETAAVAALRAWIDAEVALAGRAAADRALRADDRKPGDAEADGVQAGGGPARSWHSSPARAIGGLQLTPLFGAGRPDAEARRGRARAPDAPPLPAAREWLVRGPSSEVKALIAALSRRARREGARLAQGEVRLDAAALETADALRAKDAPLADAAPSRQPAAQAPANEAQDAPAERAAETVQVVIRFATRR